jgi:hypothetical protein
MSFVYYSIIIIKTYNMKDLLRNLMLDTISKLVKKGLTQEEATDQVIGLVDLNRDLVNDISHMETVLNGLVNIS